MTDEATYNNPPLTGEQKTVRQCDRCGTGTSTFWWNVLRLGNKEYQLCDSCLLGLVRYLEGSH